LYVYCDRLSGKIGTVTNSEGAFLGKEVYCHLLLSLNTDWQLYNVMWPIAMGFTQVIINQPYEISAICRFKRPSKIMAAVALDLTALSQLRPQQYDN